MISGGMLHLGMTTRPMRVIIGLLTVLSGFEILYAVGGDLGAGGRAAGRDHAGAGAGGGVPDGRAQHGERHVSAPLVWIILPLAAAVGLWFMRRSPGTGGPGSHMLMPAAGRAGLDPADRESPAAGTAGVGNQTCAGYRRAQPGARGCRPAFSAVLLCNWRFLVCGLAASTRPQPAGALWTGHDGAADRRAGGSTQPVRRAVDRDGGAAQHSHAGAAGRGTRQPGCAALPDLPVAGDAVHPAGRVGAGRG